MSASTLDAQADRLIAAAVAEGRLSPKPSLESLNRIARIIAPVLASMPAPVTVNAKQKRPKKVAA